MSRWVVAAALALVVTGCAGGDAGESPDASPTASVTAGTGGDGAVEGTDGAESPAPDVTAAAYEQVEILPLWASSLGETEVDGGEAAGALASLGFAGAVPEGSVAVLVPLYVRNGGQVDVDVRDAVDASFVTAAGDEYGAESGCGSFTGALDDGATVEWADDATVWVCRLVPEGAAAGGMWRVTALPEGGRTYVVAVP